MGLEWAKILRNEIIDYERRPIASKLGEWQTVRPLYFIIHFIADCVH